MTVVGTRKAQQTGPWSNEGKRVYPHPFVRVRGPPPEENFDLYCIMVPSGVIFEDFQHNTGPNTAQTYERNHPNEI